MDQVVLIGAAAAFAGVLVGLIAGGWIAASRLRRRISEVGGEIVRLRAIAEEKLSGDDPDLAALLKNLQQAADNAYRAVEALEHQADVTRRKSAAGRELISSSRHIVEMMQELGADMPDAPPTAPATAKLSPSVTAAPTAKSAPVIELSSAR